jgi:hypothetical protein
MGLRTTHKAGKVLVAQVFNLCLDSRGRLSHIYIK